MEDSEPQYARIGGLLISEWVTWIMIVVVIAAVGFGFVVGGERDAQADAAVASLDAVAARWAEADARGEMLACSDEAVDAGLLSNEYLELELRPIALDADDPSAGRGPGVLIEIYGKRDGNDALETARRLLKQLEEAEKGEDDEEHADREEDEDEDQNSRLRRVARGENSVRYEVLASLTARCPED